MYLNQPKKKNVLYKNEYFCSAEHFITYLTFKRAKRIRENRDMIYVLLLQGNFYLKARSLMLPLDVQ